MLNIITKEVHNLVLGMALNNRDILSRSNYQHYGRNLRSQR